MITMQLATKLYSIATIAYFFLVTTALEITEITGGLFRSPYQDQSVSNVTGIVTAKTTTGLYLRSPSLDITNATSNSLLVFSSTVGSNLTLGDLIVLDGRITEYRVNAAAVFTTELTSPRNVRKISSNNAMEPVLIGEGGRLPPTTQFSVLDGGDVLAVPNNISLISVSNPQLEPSKYGMDYWESLSSELVVVKGVTALSQPTTVSSSPSVQDTWVVGDWPITGKNGRDGLTMTDKDSNPEAIIIGSPLDGTINPTTTKLGDSLEDIVGIVKWDFNFYRIVPLTAIKIKSSLQPALPPPTKLESTKSCSGITIGDYNVANLTPNSTHLPKIAEHIVNYMKLPDIIFLQEIQDNNGATNDEVVDSDLTLTTLITAVKVLSNITYSYTTINPVDDQDGGEPGGNIRVAYLYNPSVLRLRNPNSGSSTDANILVSSPTGPALKFNPGRIDPTSAAWDASRKPIAAEWETLDSRGHFFTLNVHFASKGGSSSLQGDARPPVNGGVEQRTQQAELTGSFIKDILTLDPSAKIIAAGDFNEFAFAQPLQVFVERSGLVDADEVAGVAAEERYTYLFDGKCQMLDHVFVSPAVAVGGLEHLHVNTWVGTADKGSDHDPSVVKVDICN